MFTVKCASWNQEPWVQLTLPTNWALWKQSIKVEPDSCIEGVRDIRFGENPLKGSEHPIPKLGRGDGESPTSQQVSGASWVSYNSTGF